MNEIDETTQTSAKLTGSWRKSSFSNQGSCVELAPTVDGVALRNSNHPAAGTLFFTRAELAAFLAGCKNREFDDLSA